MEAIAKELGVSIATISRALNGKPGVSDELRAKVEARLKQRAYHPRRARKTAGKTRSRLHTVAFVVSDKHFEKITQGDDYYGRHLIAVQKAIIEAGLYPLLIGYNQDLNPDGMLRCVAEKRVQAIIGESWSGELADQIAKEVPVVLFNRIPASPKVDIVTTDMHTAAQESLEHLYGLGHRCIALFRVSESQTGWEGICFWQQYFSFAKIHNLSMPASILEPIHFGIGGHWEAAREFVSRILAGSERPTAIMTYDNYAPAVIQALEERGVKVPEEMSLVGFNDLKNFPELPVPLTTYRQDFDALAKEAIRLILDRIGRPSFSGRLVKIPGELIIRKSSVPPPAA